MRQFVKAIQYAARSRISHTGRVLTAMLLALGTPSTAPSKADWLDSLYFCVITLATVAYGDFSPQTAA
ncbi:MAG: potassium channel family protein [Caldilineaceae bacterium]